MPPICKVGEVLLSRTLKKVPLVAEWPKRAVPQYNRTSSAITSSGDRLSTVNGGHRANDK